MGTVDSIMTDSMMLVFDWYYSNTPTSDGSK